MQNTTAGYKKAVKELDRLRERYELDEEGRPTKRLSTAENEDDYMDAIEQRAAFRKGQEKSDIIMDY